MPSLSSRIIWLWIGALAPALLAGETPLADAVQHRHTETVAALLGQKADPNAAQADGMTALLWAVYHNDEPTARQLIGAGADVRAENRYGVGALSLAAANGNGELVKLLLAKGADPNAALHGGETALMTASRTGKLGAVRALLEAGAKIDAKERRGQTALMWAAAEGHAEVVDALLQAGADFRIKLRSGFNALFFATRQGHIAVARRLIEAGADVNQAITEARGGRNKPDKNTAPLVMAMENGHFELAAVLLKAGADPNDARTGFTPLQIMSWVRKPDIGDGETGTPPPIGSGALTSLDLVRRLVKHGADVNGPKQSKGGGRKKISVVGMTPFLCAAATADVDYMKVLLELGADPKLRDSRGRTALMMAAGLDEGPEGDGPATFAEHHAAVSYLLDLGVNDIDATDHRGETAMHGAAYKMAPNVVKLLDERGADIQVWTKKPKSGRTPLSIAQGYRPGNFKPSADTIAAIEKIMRAHGITPPPPPKKRDERWRQ